MQKIKLLSDTGAKSMRVLDVLAPLTGVAAPAVNANFIGQTFVDTVTPAIYMSVKTGSAAPADDWKKMAFAV